MARAPGVQRKRGPCFVHRVTVHFLSLGRDQGPQVSRGVTPVTASCPVEASDIRACIDESGERRNASREIHQSAATKFPTELRRPQARGTAFGTPVGPGDTKFASATHAASQDAPRYVGSCSDRDTDPGLGRMAIGAGIEAPTHAGQRKISPGPVRTRV